MKRTILSVTTIALLSFARPSVARAQLHGDVGLEAAAEKRFLTGRSGAGDASFGPSFRLSGHVALLPLIRVGLYGGYTLAPQDSTLRHMVLGGAETRVFLPLGIPNFRPFALVGFGYSRAFSASVSGGCLEVPFGVGASYRVRKPFEVGALLTSRVGFACGGDLYAQRPTAPSGDDRFGLSLGLFGSVEL